MDRILDVQQALALVATQRGIASARATARTRSLSVSGVAGRVRDPEVETELAFQQAQHAKRDASRALQCGDIDGALENYRAARIGLGRVRSHASGEMAGDFDEEIQTLEHLVARARDDANSARKISEADYHRKARRRGRR